MGSDSKPDTLSLETVSQCKCDLFYPENTTFGTFDFLNGAITSTQFPTALLPEPVSGSGHRRGSQLRSSLQNPAIKAVIISLQHNTGTREG